MFRVPPFPAFPCASRYVNTGSVADAFQRVCRSIDAREGLSLVIGPPGTGKSLLCNLLAERFEKSHSVVTLGETPIETRAAFLRRVLQQLGVDYASVPDGDLQLALIESVSKPSAAPGGLIVLIDEAQSLPADVLEAIRTTTNIMRRGEPRVCAIVCGGPHLDEILAVPSMEPFTQRIATRCYLHPLSLAETRQYISEAIRQCGADPRETISDEAISAVHHACCGVPRLLNQLMTAAIDCAEAANHTLIGLREINKAWAELQQLPSPMVDEPTFSERPPVEYGELSSYEPESQAEHIFDFVDDDASDQIDAPAFPTAGTEDEFDCEPDARFREATQRIQDMTNSVNACGIIDGDFAAFYGEESVDAATQERAPIAVRAQDCSAVRAQNCDSVNDADPATACAPVACDRSRCDTDPCDGCDKIVEPGSDAEEHLPPQSVASIEMRAPLPAALFGDFEEEEVVHVGRGVHAFSDTTTGPPASDLEAMLHEEIIGMSNHMDGLRSAEDTLVIDAPFANSPVANSPVANSLANQAGPKKSTGDNTVVAPKVLRADFGGANPAAHELLDDMLLSTDDSDLLIIEEDVDVSGRFQTQPSPREESSVTVDFQAMLKRMRSSV